jgi:hypothetical protein
MVEWNRAAHLKGSATGEGASGKPGRLSASVDLRSLQRSLIRLPAKGASRGQGRWIRALPHVRRLFAQAVDGREV